MLHRFKVLVVLTCALAVVYYISDSFNTQNKYLYPNTNENLNAQFWLKIVNTTKSKNYTGGVILVDLKSPLLPEDLYDSIRCRKSVLHIVRTTLCVHDVAKDVHVQ
jgi:hypothetical protein